MGQKHFFPRNLKEATHDYFLHVLYKCLLNGYKQAIIHIPPCSQKIIDNANHICLRFLEDAKWDCLFAMVTHIDNVVLSVHIP
jgi:hypothetical protein